MRFRLQGPAGSKAGTHYHGYGPKDPKTKEQKRYAFRDGDVIESDLDLVALHACKFVQVPDNTPLTVPAGPAVGVIPSQPQARPLQAELAPGPVAAEAADEDAAPAGAWAKEGFVEVTSEFPDAGPAGLMVIKKGRDYAVIKAADQNVPLNKDAPLKRSEVNGFIDTLVNGQT